MIQKTAQISVITRARGLVEISDGVQSAVFEAGIKDGLCTIFISHTSASLVIQENADPSVREDLEKFFERLVPEDGQGFSHTAEGPDDMPAHIKSALTATSLSIPIVGGRLVLGAWQGIYVWEHRSMRSSRNVFVNVIGE